MLAPCGEAVVPFFAAGFAADFFDAFDADFAAVFTADFTDDFTTDRAPRCETVRAALARNTSTTSPALLRNGFAGRPSSVAS